MPMSWLCVLLLCGVASVPLDDVDQALALDNACGDGASSEACSLSMLHLRSQESSDIGWGFDFGLGIDSNSFGRGLDDNSANNKCVPSTEIGCYGNGKWTGKCCLTDGNHKCAPSTELGCYGNGKWTGKCCLTDGNHRCVPSTELGCYGLGKWTGKCCLTSTNYNKCVRSTEMGCMGMGKWTGKLCCMQA